MKRSRSLLILGLILLLTLTSCTSSEDQAAAAIEAYIQALVDKDSNRLSTLSCATWEAEAKIELDSFGAVTVTLEELSCQEDQVVGEFTRVQCSGKIVANYGDEVLEINLADQTYQAAFEGGEWRMCGYQ
jgi:hypothetical protein